MERDRPEAIVPPLRDVVGPVLACPCRLVHVPEGDWVPWGDGASASPRRRRPNDVVLLHVLDHGLELIREDPHQVLEDVLDLVGGDEGQGQEHVSTDLNLPVIWIVVSDLQPYMLHLAAG